MRFLLKFMLSRSDKSLGLSGAPVRALAAFCFVLGGACCAVASRPPARQSPDSSPGFNSTFAIADFDGDRKPDLATVELQENKSSSTTQYSIRLKMTAGAVQVFGVTAPIGGLQIVARDVNGDNALDVLVSSVWLHKQVAVLLNDGHGNFTLAPPDAFPAFIWQCERLWNTAIIPLWESAALIRSHSSAGKLEERNEFPGWPSQPGRTCLRVSPGVSRLLDFSLLGRAPPTLVFQS